MSDSDSESFPEVTADNAWKLILLPPEVLEEMLPGVFQKMVQRDVDEEFLLRCTHVFAKQFVDNPRKKGCLGFDGFENACIKAGYIRTVLQIVWNSDENKPRKENPSVAAYHALDTLQFLIRKGTLIERRKCRDQMIEYGALEMMYKKLTSDVHCMQRQVVVNLIRCLTTETFLSEKLDASQTAVFIGALCEFALAGPSFWVEQMSSYDTVWQAGLFTDDYKLPPSKAMRYVLRQYAMGQDDAIWAILGFFARSPPLARQHVLKIVQSDPRILDLLFKCTRIERPEYYPELQADSLACEAIAMIFHLPLELIPGIQTPPKDKHPEWQALVQLLNILTSRPDWHQDILSVWKKVEDEKCEDLRPWFIRSKKVLMHIHAVRDKTFDDYFEHYLEYRGISRLCMLRLVATITYAEATCPLRNGAIFSLLPIAHAGSRKFKLLKDTNSKKKDEYYTSIECTQETYRIPIYTLWTRENVEAPQQIASQETLGPLTFLKLLTIMARRGSLDAISRWKRLPPGSGSSTPLDQLKNLTSPETISGILALVLPRIVRRHEGAQTHAVKDETYFARFVYCGAAELSAATVAFDRATGGKWKEHIKGAYQELALSLGAAVDMSLRSNIDEHHRTLLWAAEAVSVGENAPPGEIDDSILVKNKKRLEIAKGMVKYFQEHKAKQDEARDETQEDIKEESREESHGLACPVIDRSRCL